MRIFAAAATVAIATTGCTHSLPAAPSSAGDSFVRRVSVERRPADGYDSLYKFQNAPDGAYPNAALTLVSGELYGTTAGGGDGFAGTVFTTDPSGSERVIHSFGTGSDGDDPNAPLVAEDGDLYGTTTGGGSRGAGTVFAANAYGQEHVVYSFTGEPDGNGPYAPLLSYKHLFYGTTYAGGTSDRGAVFAVDEQGRERVVHSFGGPNDGENPYAGVIAPTGIFYGTTYYGGAYGKGTVFSLTASGHERVVYSFGSSASDGANPRGGLTFLGGMLYGTTCFGGIKSAGTVFKMTLSGEETRLHDFKGEPDGANPFDTLLPIKGVLYGTTYSGGLEGACSSSGCGTIFEITPSGKELTLYRFLGERDGDGSAPWGGVVQLGNYLYGTASLGGNGIGTIFRIAP
jgi:uncharacterized repeat protein (TIGR03803 family)